MISNAGPSRNYPSSGIFISNTVKALNNNNQKVDWVYITKDFKIYKVVKVFKYLYLYIKSIKYLLVNRYDLIHIHFISHTGILGLILKIIRPEVPLILNFHGSDINASRLIPIKKIILNSNLIISPSKVFLEKIKSKYPNTTPTYVYPSGGVDCNLFHPKIAHAKTNNEIHFGYISRITFDKGIWDYIYAIEKLNYKNYKVIAHIIGEGPENSRVNNYIKRVNKRNLIFYNHGSVAQNKLPNYYNNFDIFIFPSKRVENESLGLVALEALACGVPIIGTDIPITKLYIKHNFNGFIYKAGDVESLIISIQKYLNLDINIKTKMQLNARTTALNFERNKVTNELLEKYKRII